MQNSKNNKGRFTTQVGGTLIKPKPNPKGNLFIILLLLSALVVLAYICAKAVKVIFRKNFEKEAIGSLTVSISSLFFFCIGIWAFVLMNSSNSLAGESTPELYFITGMLHIFLALFIFIRGIYHRKHADDEYNRDGESYLLGTLEQEGWNPIYVRNIAEPILIISVGHFLYYVTWLAGLPLICCGVSIWIVQLVDPLLFGNPIQRNIDKLNKYHNLNSQFNEVPNF